MWNLAAWVTMILLTTRPIRRGVISDNTDSPDDMGRSSWLSRPPLHLVSIPPSDVRAPVHADSPEVPRWIACLESAWDGLVNIHCVRLETPFPDPSPTKSIVFRKRQTLWSSRNICVWSLNFFWHTLPARSTAPPFLALLNPQCVCVKKNVLSPHLTHDKNNIQTFEMKTDSLRNCSPLSRVMWNNSSVDVWCYFWMKNRNTSISIILRNNMEVQF